MFRTMDHKKIGYWRRGSWGRVLDATLKGRGRGRDKGRQTIGGVVVEGGTFKRHWLVEEHGKTDYWRRGSCGRDLEET